MEIGAVSILDFDSVDKFFEGSGQSTLQGRKVAIFSRESNPCSDRIHIAQQMQVFLIDRLTSRRPMMSRPDHVDGRVKGGYDEKRGGYVEGEIEFGWDNKPDKESNSHEKRDPDSSGHNINSDKN